jgi:hypothetical protein
VGGGGCEVRSKQSPKRQQINVPMTTHDLESCIVQCGDVKRDGPNFHRLVSSDCMSKDTQMKKILNLRPKRPGPGGPRAIEMISNGGTKPCSAVSEIEVGPRARNVDLTSPSLSLGDVNGYVRHSKERSLRLRPWPHLNLRAKRIRTGVPEVSANFQRNK